MTEEQAEEIVELMHDDGYQAEVYRSYSGRGMFGDTCTGIVTDNPALIGYYAAKTGSMLAKDIPTRRDNMGLGIIIY